METYCPIERLKAQFSSFDPRLYQIASLGTLLLYGLFWLHFDVSVAQIVVTFGTALLTQYAGTRWHKLPSFDPLSPLVSALGLCIFLRTNDLMVVALASFLAIASKFVIRWEEEAPLQSHQLCVGGRHCERPCLDFAGAVGPSRLVRVSDCLPWQPGRHPCSAGGCDAVLSRVLCRPADRTGAVAGRSLDHPAASNRKRHAADFFLLHDLGPENHA